MGAGALNLIGNKGATKAANDQNKLSGRSLDMTETEKSGIGDISDMILKLINGNTALDATRVKAQEGAVMRQENEQERNFLNAKQTLPGGGDARDTTNAEQRARLVAAQQDLMFRRNRALDLELLQAKITGLMAAGQLGGIRPEYQSDRIKKMRGIGTTGSTLTSGYAQRSGVRRDRVDRNDRDERGFA